MKKLSQLGCQPIQAILLLLLVPPTFCFLSAKLSEEMKGNLEERKLLRNLPKCSVEGANDDLVTKPLLISYGDLIYWNGNVTASLNVNLTNDKYCDTFSDEKVSCVFQLKTDVDPKRELDRIEKLYVEEFLKLIYIASKTETAFLTTLASKAEMIGSNETIDLTQELIKLEKNRLELDLIVEILEKIESGNLIHDLTSEEETVLRDITLSPKIISEASENLRKQLSKNKANSKSRRTCPGGSNFNFGLIAKDLIQGITSDDFKSLSTMTKMVRSNLTFQSFGKVPKRPYKISKILRGNLIKRSGPLLENFSSEFRLYLLLSRTPRFHKSLKNCRSSKKLEKEVENLFFLNLEENSLGKINLKTLDEERFKLKLGLNSFSQPDSKVLNEIKYQVSNTLTHFKCERFMSVSEDIKQGFKVSRINRPIWRDTDSMDVKKVHNKIIAQAVDFLKTSPHISRYAVPSKVPKYEEYKETLKMVDSPDNSIYLSDNVIGHMDQDFPLQEVNVFCNDLNTIFSILNPRKNQKCQNALGIEYLLNREGDYSLTDFGDGLDLVLETNNHPNIFLVGAGVKYFQGGNGNDLFVLEYGPVVGFLMGEGGINFLILEETFMSTHRIFINLDIGILTYKYKKGTLFLKGIRVVTGRRNAAEELIPSCSTDYIDLKGGTSRAYDEIILKNSKNCSYSMTIVLHNQTNITPFESKGQFRYIVSTPTTFCSLINNFSIDSKHTYYFPFNARDITSMHFNTYNQVLELKKDQDFTFRLTLKPDEEKEKISPQINFVTHDDVTFHKSASGNISGLFCGNENGGSTVKGLKTFPNFINVESGNQNLFGGENNDIFYLSGGPFKGRLFGNGGEDFLFVSTLFVPGQRIKIDLSNAMVSSTSSRFEVHGITSVVGRSNLGDDIFPNCDTKFISGEGGNSKNYDQIVIQDQKCGYNLRVVLNRFTKLINSATSGNFTYEIEKNGSMEIFTNASSANHNCLLPELGQELDPVFNQETRTVSLFRPNDDIVRIGISFSKDQVFHSQPRILTRDFLEIRITQEGVVQGFAYLNDDTPLASGLANLPNNFVLQGGGKVLAAVGGQETDTILLRRSPIKGSVNGLEGLDILMLDDDFCSNQTVIIDFTKSNLTSSSGDSLHFSNVEAIVGRESAVENVIVSCQTISVDTKGGSNTSAFDFIQIPYDENCWYSLRITGREHTLVDNSATAGTFLYEIPREGHCILHLTLTKNTTHNFFFANYLEEFIHITFDELTGRIHFHTDQGNVLNQNLKLLEENQPFYTNTRFITRDNFEIKISRFGNLVASSSTNVPPQEIISKFSKLANSLSMSLLFFNNQTQEMVHIGTHSTRGPDILNNDPTLRSHLVGNGGENVYVITTNEEMLSGKEWLVPIPEVVIYGSDPEENSILDLSLIVRPIRAEVGSDYSPEIIQDGEDLCINIHIHLRRITTIRLKKAIFLLNKLQVILNAHPMNIVNKYSKWTFSPSAIEFTIKNSYLFLNNDDLENGTEINIPNLKASPHLFYYLGNNLILTNLLLSKSENDNITMIVLRNFLKESKLRTVIFSFSNEQIYCNNSNCTEPGKDVRRNLEAKKQKMCEFIRKKYYVVKVENKVVVSKPASVEFFILSLILFCYTFVLIIKLLVDMKNSRRRNDPT